jgi:hypothetical protein
MPAMSETPKRRWHQFRLRTLMIAVTLLAVPCAYVGHQLKWNSDRHEVRSRYQLLRVENNDGTVGPHAPWPLGWLGEWGFHEVNVPESTPESEIERLKAIFPEAQVQRKPTLVHPVRKQ